MSEQRMMGGKAEDGLDLRVVEALERVPAVEIPAGFAARVAGQVPARKAVVLTPARYGMVAARIGMAVLVVAIVVMSMSAGGHTRLGIGLEYLLCAQLVGLAMWIGGVGTLGNPSA